MSRHSNRLFTVEEANELVPELSDIFAAVREEKVALDGLLPEVRLAAGKAQEGGGSVHGERYVKTLQRINSLLARVERLGVVVKDIERGLCDFPYDRGGEVVFLCWKYGEPEVAWWHRIQDGFRGRRAVEELPEEC